VSASTAPQHESSKFESWNDQSVFFSTYAPSLRWWLDRLRSISLFSYLFWVPMFLFFLLLFMYPRTLLILIWTVTKHSTKAIFLYLFHPDEHHHHEGDLEDEEDDAAVKELGIVKPPNTIWEVPWDKLTDGQKSVMDMMGIPDEKEWLARCARHGGIATPRAEREQEHESLGHRLAMRDWEELDTKQKRGMSSLGFTRESWHRMSDGMPVHEKMWSELSSFEMQTVKKFDGMNEDNWNNRSATIFRTPWHLMGAEDAHTLRKLGFNSRHWKAYKDPKYRKPGSGGMMSRFLRIFDNPQDMLMTLLVGWASAWAIFVMWRMQIFQMLLSQIGMYVLLFMGLLACVMLSFAELFQMVHDVHHDVVVKMRRVHLYITSFWETASEVPHDIALLIDDIRKVVTALKSATCKHCNCCQFCLPKPCKSCQNCGPSCLPWKS